MNGRRRHLICDTIGLLLAIRVTAADVTDRQAAARMLPPCGHGSPPSPSCGPTPATPASWSPGR
ncbi:hypothetical protein [Streptomyces sp. NPDC048611]|uniref:hypothetical protein n=1 Tax=Streptomyces sp. NPDC048611 TaxID=3155635 RepID=UPI00342CC5FC